jgi:transmembrane 9 superfamily member 2/4
MLLSVDFIEYIRKSAPKTAPLTVLGLSVLWLLLAIPASFYGAKIGFGHKKLERKKVNSIRRNIPMLPLYLRRRFTLPVFGAVIFGSIFGEFQYVMKSVWRSQMYAMFGFLLVNLHLLVVIVGLLSII